MILSDPKWDSLNGGYRTPYDPRPALANIAAGVDLANAWDELWNELHHQGDVGEASYATVTALIDLYASGLQPDWNLFSLAATIEVERHRRSNPPLPDWLRADYENALKRLKDMALLSLRDKVDSSMMQSALSILAIANGELKLGALIIHLDSSELDEILGQYLDWANLYHEKSN
jgi:hypothetical protein